MNEVTHLADIPMSEIEDRVESLFRQGHTCAEAIYMTFAEIEGYLSLEALRICSMFFGGLCYLGGNCGTLLGGLAVIGARESHTDPAEKALRNQAQSMGVELILWFQEQFGSTDCEEIIDLYFQDQAGEVKSLDGDTMDQLCAPMLRRTCAWLVDRFSEES